MTPRMLKFTWTSSESLEPHTNSRVCLSVIHLQHNKVLILFDFGPLSMFGFTFLRISNIYSFLIQFIRNLVMMILPMWNLDHVKSENLNNQRKSSLTDAVHVYYSALQWPNGRFIYLLFVLDNLGRLLQTSNLVPAHETRR